MMPYFKIVNGGTTSVALSGLTIRYYFTQDTSSGQLFQCDFAMPPLVCSTLMPGNNNVIGTFVTMPMSTWTTTADHYLELSFPASTETIVPNGDTGEIEVASVDKNYDNVFYQNNDYSYNGGALTAYVIWNQVTLYQNGLLVWGVPP